ncbi:MAG: YciI family protein, partial [Nitrospira sp.]|nr:YciI family protein [Nitrospira sp.]
MKYLCLVYVEEMVLNAFPSDKRRSISEEAISYCEKLQKAGQLLAASPLHPVETATTVRVRAGKTSTTDGPFAETKEQLGGFLMIDVPDLNDAIRIAAQFPAAKFGSIEVR